MALYTEQALINQLNKKGGKQSFKPEVYPGLVYEEPDGTKKYIVVGKQGGNPGTPRNNRQERIVRRKKQWHPESKKVEAATLHVAVGNMARVAELAKVPIATLYKWQDQPWWLSTQQRVKREAVEETDAKFSKLVDKAIHKLQTAIEDGDYIYDFKKGQLVKIPMTGRDLAIVAGTVFDKRQLLRGEATKISKTPDTDKHLQDLAERFAALVNEKVNKPLVEEKVIEGEHTVIEDPVPNEAVPTV